MRNITYTMTLLTLLLLALNTATANAQGGSIQAPGVTLHSVCGDATRGLLYAVGNDTTNGLIYRITNLNTFPTTPVKKEPPTPQYIKYIFYSCEVASNYLFVVGEGAKKGGSYEGLIFVYDISNPSSPTLLDSRKTGTKSSVEIRYRDVEVKLIDSTYYIYALSVLSDGTTRLDNAAFSGSTIDKLSSITICSGSGCNGYGISIYGNYLGVLWKNGSNLYLSVYDVSSGSPASGQTVTIVTSFTGARAAEAAYSGGFLVAASGTIYRVYLDGTTWKSETLVNNVFSGDAYAMLVAEKNGAKAAYVFTQVNTAISISAIDLVNNKIAYTSSVANVGQAMEGYGDAYIIWVDPNNNIVSSTTPNARPYMVYTVTITSSAPSSYAIYYDLTRGGTTPYPVPEPWLTNIVVIIVSAISTTIILKKS